VSAIACPFIEVHLFRRSGRRVEFLCLRRARTRRLPGVWQPVTGKRRRGETALAAARREVREETGLEPRRWWALEEPTLLYQPTRDEVIAIPVFAAEADPRDRVRLSGEHDAHVFLGAGAAGRRYLWESQRRALADVRRQVLRGGALADALALPAPAPARATARRPAAPRRRKRTA
jgi:8-oxo-dGTP pyrophosphatase MutT (NUDIX family)